jgi:hypothetical protein
MAILKGLCTVKQIENLTHPEIPYGPDTDPTLDTVEAWIDEDYVLLEPALVAAGIVVPVVDQSVKDQVGIVQSYRVAGKIEHYQHFTNGQVASPYAEWLMQEGVRLKTELATAVKLPAGSTDENRIVLPQQIIYSKNIELWDSSKEDTGTRMPMFTVRKKF